MKKEANEVKENPESVEESPGKRDFWEEVNRLLDALTGAYALMAGLLYGAELRLMECVRLRVKGVDFAQNQIVVRDGKPSAALDLVG